MERKSFFVWLLLLFCYGILPSLQVSQYFDYGANEKFDLGGYDLVFRPKGNNDYSICVYKQSGKNIDWERYEYSNSDSNRQRKENLHPDNGYDYEFKGSRYFRFSGTNYDRVIVQPNGYIDFTNQYSLWDGSWNMFGDYSFLKKRRIAPFLSDTAQFNSYKLTQWIESGKYAIFNFENFCDQSSLYVSGGKYPTYYCPRTTNFQMALELNTGNNNGKIMMFYDDNVDIRQTVRIGVSFGTATQDIDFDISSLTIAQPVTFSYGARNTSALSFSWSEMPHVQYYVVGIYQAGSSETKTWKAVDTPSVTFTGLDAGTDYYIAVWRACNDWQDSDSIKYSSNSAQSATRKTLPVAPTGLVGTSTTNSISLTWNSVNGATSYKITYGSKTHTATATSITVSDLSPLTQYIIRVYSGIGNDFGDLYAEISLYTRPSPVTNIKITALDSTSATVAWNGGTATLFNIYLTLNGDSVVTAVDRTTATYTFNDLTPNTLYSLIVFAGKENIGYENGGASLSITTLPNPPGGLTMTGREGTTLTFGWNTSPGLSYKLTLYMGTTIVDSEDDVTTDSYKFSGLSLASQYVVRVSSGRDGYFSSAYTTASGQTYGNPATNLVVASASTTSLSYSWTAPPGAVQYSLILEGSSGGKVETSTAATTYTFNSLTANAAYTFKVYAAFNEGKTLETTGATLTTGHTLVAAATNLKRILVDTNTMSFNWTAPTGAGKFAVSLVGGNVNQQLEASTNSITFSGLSGHTEYTLRVLSGNDKGYEPVGVDGKFTTLPLAPSTLSFVPAADQLSVTWAPVVGADIYEASIYNGDTHVLIETLLPVSNTGVTFTELSPDQLYIVVVKSGIVDQDGNIFQSVGKTGSQVTSLSTVSNLVCTPLLNGDLKFDWNPTLNVVNYQIDFGLAGGTTERHTVTTEGKTFGSLQPGKSYTFNIVPEFNESTGPASRITCQTFPEPPETFEANVVKSTEINLSWSSSEGAEIYLLTLNATGKQEQTRSTTALTVAFLNLEPGIEYMVKIQAGIAAGYSPQYKSLTQITAPGVPSNIQLGSRFSNGLMFTWSPVETANGYEAQLWSLGGSLKEEMEPTTTSASFTGLDPDATYVLNLWAKSLSGKSNSYAIYSAKTFPNPPTGFSSITTSISADVNWNSVFGVEYQLKWAKVATELVWSAPVIISGSGTYSITNLQPNTNYRVIVYSGYSEYGFELNGSVPYDFWTRTEPVASITCSEATQSSFRVSWPQVEGANSYRVTIGNRAPVTTNNLYMDSPTGLTGATNYQVKVESGKGDTFENVGKIATCFTMPPRTGNLALYDSSSSTLHFRWSLVSEANAYKAELYMTNMSLVDSLEVGNVVSADFTVGLDADTRYILKVFTGMSNGAYESIGTKLDDISIRTHTLPATNLHVVNYTYNAISVAWDAPSGSTGFQIGCYVGEQLFSVLNLQGASTMEATFEHLSPFTEYTIYVFSQNDGGLETVGVDVTQSTHPGLVDNVVVEQTHNSITATWGASTGAGAYRVQLCGGITPCQVNDVIEGKTSTLFTSLDANTEYVIKIFAGVDLSNLDSAYVEISVYTFSDPLTSVAVLSANSNSIRFSFPLTEGTTGILVRLLDEEDELIENRFITEFEVDRRRSGAVGSLGDLTPATQYNFQFLTISQGGTGVDGPTLQYSTFPTMVTDFTGVGNLTIIDFTWTAVDGADYYLIYRYSSSVKLDDSGKIEGTSFEYAFAGSESFNFTIYVCIHTQIPSCSSEGLTVLASKTSVRCEFREEGHTTWQPTNSDNWQTGTCESGYAGEGKRYCDPGSQNWAPISQVINPCMKIPLPLTTATVSVSYDSATISWGKIPDASLFRVDMLIPDTFTVTSTSATSLKISKLDSYTYHLLRIHAGTAGGHFETAGYELDFTTDLQPPIGLTAHNVKESSFLLSWTSPPSVQSFKVYVQGGKYATSEFVAESYVTEYLLTNLDKFTNYTVTVYSSQGTYVEPLGASLLVRTLGSDEKIVNDRKFIMDGYAAIIGVVVAYIVTFIVYLIARKQNPHGRNSLVFVAGFGLIGFAVHVAFLFTLPSSNTLFVICLLLIVVTCLLNVFATVYVLFKEIRLNKKAIPHFEKRPMVTATVVIFSIFNMEILDITASGMFLWSSLSHSFTYSNQVLIVFFSCISNVFEDIPLLGIIVYWILYSPTAIGTLVFVALGVTLVSLIFGIFRRIYLFHLWQTKGKTHQDLYTNFDGLREMIGTSYLSMEQLQSNPLIYPEPTILFSSGGGGLVFSEPTQIYDMTANNVDDRPDKPYVYIIHPNQQSTSEVPLTNNCLKFGNQPGENIVGFSNSVLLPTHCEIRWSPDSPLMYKLVGFDESTLINGVVIPSNQPIELQTDDIVQMGVAKGNQPGVPVVFSVRFISVMKPENKSACIAIQMAESLPIGPLGSPGADSAAAGNHASIAPNPNTSAPALVVLRAANYPNGTSVVDISGAPLYIGSGMGINVPNILRVNAPGMQPVQLRVFATTSGGKFVFRANDPIGQGNTMVDGQLLHGSDSSVPLAPGSTIQFSNNLFIQVSQMSLNGPEPHIELLFPDASVLDVNSCRQR